MKIKLKTITPKGLKKYQTGLCELLKAEWNTPEELLKSFKNSQYIIMALDWERVVGVFQILTDRHYVALLINLWVDPEYRKSWIGWKIVEKTLEEAKKLKTKSIKLTPDPHYPWLNALYAKYGFTEGVYMQVR